MKVDVLKCFMVSMYCLCKVVDLLKVKFVCNKLNWSAMRQTNK